MGQQNLQIVLDGQYIGGCDSYLPPTDLAQGTYAWGVNGINRGGVFQTRPAKRRIVSFCGRRAQGHYWVRTMDDRNYEMVAIDGKIYWSSFPFGRGTWSQLPGVIFDPTAQWIYFQNTIQAIEYDNAGNVVVLPNPKNIVFMQDGVSTPCYWDVGAQGTTPDQFASGIVNLNYIPGNPSPKKVLPIGTAMLWQDNRLWVADGPLVYASDILYGASFHEDTYLAEKTGFRFPRAVVNMFPAPVQGIQVYTESSIHALSSFI